MTVLSEALALWRRTRHPDVERVVRAHSQQIDADPDLARQPVPAAQWRWMARLRQGDDRDVEELLRALPSVDEGRLAAVRLEALWERGPDPRVGDAAVRWAVELRFHDDPDHYTWWLALREVLVRGLSHDFDFGGLARQIREAQPSVGGAAQSERVAVLESLAPPPQKLSRRQRLVVQAWHQDLPKVAAPDGPPTDLVGRLFDQVVADPEADDVRAVLADLWLERGDPRGDFVRLQLEAARTPRGPARQQLEEEAERLFVGLGAAWFGRWLAALADVGCRRGFLHRIKLLDVSSHVDRICHNGWARTVRVVELPKPHDRGTGLVRLLSHPTFRNVRHVDHLTQPEFADLVERGAPELSTLSIRHSPTGRPLDLRALGTPVRAMPSLQRLELPLRSRQIQDLRHLAVPELVLRTDRRSLQRWARGVLPAVAKEVQRLVLSGPDGEQRRYVRQASGRFE